MNKKIILLVLHTLFVGIIYAQQHLPESKSLVGLWRQAGIAKMIDGEIKYFKSGNYKVMNTDGTFYTFITWGEAKNNPVAGETSISMYGTYILTSDSTFSEHIVKHSVNEKMNNSYSELKYKFVPDTDNQIISLMYKNKTTNEWIPEVWERVAVPIRKEKNR